MTDDEKLKALRRLEALGNGVDPLLVDKLETFHAICELVSDSPAPVTPEAQAVNRRNIAAALELLDISDWTCRAGGDGVVIAITGTLR